MFTKQYVHIFILLKTSKFLLCLTIKGKFPYLYISNGLLYTIIKIPINRKKFIMLNHWQKNRLNRFIFIDALLEQKYLINRINLSILNPVCLKTCFFIQKKKHIFNISIFKFKTLTIKNLSFISKRIFIYYNRNFMSIYNKNLFCLVKTENIQSKILSHIFYRGIKFNIFNIRVVMAWSILINSRVQHYIVINRHYLIDKFLKSRFLINLINNCKRQLIYNIKHSKIHGYFFYSNTITGRISCLNPNIQGINKTHVLRKCIQTNIKYILIGGDFSSYELRIAAHVAQDKELSKDLLRIDFHTHIATNFFKKNATQIFNNTLRSKIKIIIFAIIYGMNFSTLAKNINVSKKLAKNIIEKFLIKYSDINNYMIKQTQKGGTNKNLQSCFMRYFLFNYSSQESIFNISKNVSIQTTAAEIIKTSMFNLYEKIYINNCHAFIINTIHDEILIETKACNKYSMSYSVSEEMGYTIFILLSRIKSFTKININTFWQ